MAHLPCSVGVFIFFKVLFEHVIASTGRYPAKIEFNLYSVSSRKLHRLPGDLKFEIVIKQCEGLDKTFKIYESLSIFVSAATVHTPVGI